MQYKRQGLLKEDAPNIITFVRKWLSILLTLRSLVISGSRWRKNGRTGAIKRLSRIIKGLRKTKKLMQRSYNN
jgi:hypothetical protein